MDKGFCSAKCESWVNLVARTLPAFTLLFLLEMTAIGSSDHFDTLDWPDPEAQQEPIKKQG